MVEQKLLELENGILILRKLIEEDKITPKQLSLELDVLNRRTNELYMQNLLNQLKGDVDNE